MFWCVSFPEHTGISGWSETVGSLGTHVFHFIRLAAYMVFQNVVPTYLPPAAHETVAAAGPALGVLHLLIQLFWGVRVGIAPWLAFAFPQWPMSLMLYGYWYGYWPILPLGHLSFAYWFLASLNQILLLQITFMDYLFLLWVSSSNESSCNSPVY